MNDDSELLSAIQISAANRGFNPLMQESLRLQNEAARRSQAPVDTTALQKAAYERAIQGQQQQMAGMALASATPEYRGIAGHTYQQGSEAQGPTDFGEGVFVPGQGYTPDPHKARDRLTKTMAAQAEAARQFGSAYGQQEDREAGRAHQAAVLAEQQRHARVIEANAAATLAQGRAAGRLVAFKGPNDEPYFMDTRTRQVFNPLGGAVGGGGGGATPGTYPATASPRAGEDERRTAYQTQAIAGRAATVDPAHAAPGFFEAAARTFLPGDVGTATANAVSSAPRQVARQSQEGIVDSLIWLTTGAGTTKEQVAQQRGEYLPNYFDKPEAVVTKRAKLAQLAEAARNRAGRAWTQQQEVQLRQAFPELAQPGGAPPLAPPSSGAAPRGGGARRTVGGRSYVFDGVGWKPE